MKVALIITTYNWPEAIDLCLAAVAKQSVKPDQVIVCDDGSREGTKKVVEKWFDRLPLSHAWHEDLGFRAARCRNLGLRLVDADYVISIDGDMIIHRDFVRDHICFAKEHTFVQGSRVLLGDAFSKRAMSDVEKWEWNKSEIAAGCIGNAKNLFRSKILSKLIGFQQKACAKNTRTCNMAFWMADLKAVNGFDNCYEGWGREDSDLAYRLVNYGVKKRKLKHAALALHLFHEEESRDSLPENDILLERVLTDKSYYRCKNGIEEK